MCLPIVQTNLGTLLVLPSQFDREEIVQKSELASFMERDPDRQGAIVCAAAERRMQAWTHSY